jgi:hypothetical protein
MGSKNETACIGGPVTGKGESVSIGPLRSTGRMLVGWLVICADGLDYHMRREDDSPPMMLPW